MKAFIKRLRCLVTLAHAREVYGVATTWKPYGRNLRGMRAVATCKGCGGELP